MTIKNETDICIRLREADRRRDWCEMSDLLDEATREDIKKLKPLIPELLEHRHFLVRTSAVELIEDFNLRSLTHLAQARLADRNALVRSYALMAYSRVAGAKALSEIAKGADDKDVGVRVTALVLSYVKTRDKNALEKLRKTLRRKTCRDSYRESTLRMFDLYMKGKPGVLVVKLYEEILPLISACGVLEDMRGILNAWKQPPKGRAPSRPAK